MSSQGNNMSFTRNTSFFRGTIFGFLVSLIVLTVIHSSYSFYKAHQEENALKQQVQEGIDGSTDISSQRSLALPNIRAPMPRRSNEKGLISSRDVNIDVLTPQNNDNKNQKKASIVTPSGTIPTAVQPAVISQISPITVTKGSIEPPYTRDKCSPLYNNRKYLELNNQRLPPIFYTFPGSGNTWGRLLIEYATGIYTGSVYNDRSLLQALPGEFTCDRRVSVVKVHPHTHDFVDLHGGTFHSDDNKCKRGKVLKFERAILLIRDPYDSIWSEYQRRVTQSHVDGILRQGFEWNRWQANAAALSHAYNNMWAKQYKDIEKRYKPKDVLYVRYEDLKNRDTRVQELQKIVQFLNIPASIEKLECAFALAENKKAHRAIDPDLEMTKDIAYTKELACRMWSLFGKYAAEHDYKPWKQFDCNGFPQIPTVNVGPRGEYDRKWIKNGQKLLDFGGYTKDTPLKEEDKFNVLRPKVIKIDPRVIESFGANVHGMTMEDAMSVLGIAKLGEDGPVWQ